MSENVLTEDDLALERLCPKCYGVEETCKVCGGGGKVITRFGEEVLNFVRKYLRQEG